MAVLIKVEGKVVHEAERKLYCETKKSGKWGRGEKTNQLTEGYASRAADIWARPETPQPKIIYFGVFGVLPEISADRCPEPPQKPYSGGFWGLLGKNTLFLTHFWVF